MNIVIASGSFKDVYTSIEACEMLKNNININCNVDVMPICDGGENTYEVMKYYLDCDEIFVENVYNSYLQLKTVPYLVFNNQAYIISSKIIKLSPDEENYKNPLLLSDYGVGQLIKDALDRGYKKINICIGGTSTVDYGIGLLQALGAKIYDKYGKIISRPICGKDIIKISKIVCKPIYKNVEINILADGNIGLNKMKYVTKYKIGWQYNEFKENIMKELNEGLMNLCKLTDVNFDTPFLGAAGGILIGINMMFTTKCKLGGEYYVKLFNIEEKIKNSNLVITGEGRFDNSECGKTPIVIAKLCKINKKRLIFVCGQIDNPKISKCKSVIKNDTYLKSIGIDILITCQKFYNTIKLSNSYKHNLELFKLYTPIVLKEKMKEVGI